MPTEPTTVELGDYLGVIRRRYIVVGLAVVVCLALGAGYGLTRPDVYRSTAQIALPQLEGQQLAAVQAAQVQTELAVLRSDLVADRAAREMPGDADGRALLGHLSVEEVTEAQVLTLFYSAGTADEAQGGAQAFADAYTALKRSEQAASQAARAATFNDRIAEIDEGIDAQTDIREEAEPDSREFRQAQSEIDGLNNTKSDLTAQLTEIESEVVDGGTIITPARRPQQPRAKGLGRTMAAAFAAGLLLGLGAAFVLDRLDTRVRGAADLQQTLGVRTLGSIPLFPDHYRHPELALVTVHAPNGPEADAFRRLRTSVLLATRSAEARTLCITSSVADEGKTTVAANLAVALAQSGRQVLLVAADLRRNGIEELFELPAAPGLTEILLDQATLGQVEHRVGDLTVITRGSPVDNPTDLFGTETMARAIEALVHRFDHVIFDSPPVLAVADVLVLAPQLDATLMVVSLAQASTAQVAEAGSELSLAGATVLGAVLNSDAESSRRSASATAYGIRY